MRLKIIKEEKVVKEYEFKGTLELEIITGLRRMLIYADDKELRFYILKEGEKVVVPAGMIKKQEISL